MIRWGRCGDVREAAVAAELAFLGTEQQRLWAVADEARLIRAMCLHRLGRCDDAVVLLRCGWERPGAGLPDKRLVAAFLAIKLLVYCHRQEQAGEVWAEVELASRPAGRRRAFGELIDYASWGLTKAGARVHGEICMHRREPVKVL